MSQKWRSSKKVLVDGEAFKRERVSCTVKDEGPMRGQYKYGSQGWLAGRARVSARTVNELEAGHATLKTVDAVSEVLGIKGRQYIRGYGEDSTTLRVPGCVDFRSVINGRMPGCEQAYLDGAFLVTLVPCTVVIDDDFIDSALLKKMTLNLKVEPSSVKNKNKKEEKVPGIDIDFTWLYEVNLTNKAKTWLGDEEEVSDVLIYEGEPHKKSIMFRQNSITPMSWKGFMDIISKTGASGVLLTVDMNFEYFNKKDHILISIAEVKSLLELGYPKGSPYWVEPNALSPQNFS